MVDLLFGPAGVPRSAKDHSTESGIQRVAELGLECMELEFVQGVKMSEKTALSVGKLAREKAIALSAHAPYFINLNAQEPEKILASKKRLQQTIRIASLCGARSIVFHAAYYLNEPHQNVYDRVKTQLEEVISKLEASEKKVWIRPEVMGKHSQFGTLDEVISLSSEVNEIAPCIDFAHWHARTGKFNTYSEFTSAFEQIKNKLGRTALDNVHIHVSGIAYSKSGEIKHLNLKESDFNYLDFIKALKSLKIKGLVISESPNLEEDALLLKEAYASQA
ncbi:MAG: TIM barrel protein [Chloroflexota bacterium]|nr:TIM barrel protein [Chloroflexota bacterium]